MRFDQVNPQPPPIRPRPSRTRLVGMGDGNTDTPPPQTPVVMPIVTAGKAKQQPAWKMFLNSPAAKVAIGLIIGFGLLPLVARFVDLPATIQVLKQRLTKPPETTCRLLLNCPDQLQPPLDTLV